MRSIFTLLLFCLSSHFIFPQSPCFYTNVFGTGETEISQYMVELSDGSVYVAGKKEGGPIGLNDAALLKYDSCGNLLWIKYYGDTLEDGGLSICKTHDEKIVMTVESQNANFQSDILILKLDTSGAIIFQKKFNPTINQSARYIEETSDHGFVFCGYVFDGNVSNDSYFVKTDSVGNIIWQQQVGGAGNEYADMIRETADGSFVGTADASSTVNGDYDVEVIKFNANGGIIWDKFYGDNVNNGCQGIGILSDGNYISYGETEIYTNSAFDFYMEIIDTAGNSLGRHVFGGIKTDALFSLVELPGMNFLCTGYSRNYNGAQAYDMVLFKIDSSANIKWVRNFYNPGIDIGYQLLASSFGGYLITGLYENNGNSDFFLMRTDTIPNTPIGMEEHFPGASFSTYPNPCNDKVSVESYSAILKAELLNVHGETVYSVRANEKKLEIPTREIEEGMYFLKITSAEGSAGVRKIIVTH